MFDKYIDNGFYEISEQLAKRLCGGDLPQYGHEKLVAHNGKHYWLTLTKNWRLKSVWSVRDAGSWRLVDGQAVLGGSNGQS